MLLFPPELSVAFVKDHSPDRPGPHCFRYIVSCLQRLRKSYKHVLQGSPAHSDFSFSILCQEVESSQEVESALRGTLIDMEIEKMEVWMTEYYDGTYKVTWRLESTPTVKKKGRLVTYAQILRDYPAFYHAVDEAHGKLNPVVGLQTLHMVAAVNIAETVMKRKRHLVYTHLAWACGFASRIELPKSVVDAVRAEWSEPGKSFVGFIDN